MLVVCSSIPWLTGFYSRKMGAYKYVGELYKKKQSDVLRFLFRVRYVSKISLSKQENAHIYDLKLLGISSTQRDSPYFTPFTP